MERRMGGGRNNPPMNLPPPPEPDARFAALVRERFDPVLLPHGFLFNDVFASAAPSRARLVMRQPGEPPAEPRPTPITRETSLLYEAHPRELLERRPELRDWVDPKSCADLWIRLDMDTHHVEAYLSLDLVTMLEQLGEDVTDLQPTPEETPEQALDRYALAAHRLFSQQHRG